MPLASGSPLTVHKLDAQGREIWRYPGRLLRATADRVVLEAEFGREAMDAGGLLLEPGDRFVETFYTQRWYSVFAVHHGPGPALKGWYCNIARPARSEGADLFSEDLALDLVVFGDGSWRILDQEEFDALVLPETERAQALAALAELQELVRQGRGPFRAEG